jgi:hypothetical protein
MTEEHEASQAPAPRTRRGPKMGTLIGIGIMAVTLIALWNLGTFSFGDSPGGTFFPAPTDAPSTSVPSTVVPSVGTSSAP